MVEFSTLGDWFGPGNVVDIPALEWLCHQRGPRTWISDGVVTGEGDAGCEALASRAGELVQRGRIEVHASIPDYLAPRLRCC
jgi:hypothetical protein